MSNIILPVPVRTVQLNHRLAYPRWPHPNQHTNLYIKDMSRILSLSTCLLIISTFFKLTRSPGFCLRYDDKSNKLRRCKNPYKGTVALLMITLSLLGTFFYFSLLHTTYNEEEFFLRKFLILLMSGLAVASSAGIYTVINKSHRFPELFNRMIIEDMFYK